MKIKQNEWVIVVNDSVDPFFNIASEIFLAKEEPFGKKNIFMLWQNYNSIIIGRNQSVDTQIHNDEVKKNKVNIVRRLSGGGTVYQDKGTLIYTFLVQNDFLPEDKTSLYAFFIEPITSTLQSLGVDAKVFGKNDIYIGDKKISGNSQIKYENSFLHHGTILFNENVEAIYKYLNPNLIKLKSKMIDSRRSPIANVSDYMSKKISINEFKKFLIDYNFKDVKKVHFNQQQIKKIKKIAKDKLMNKKWLYIKKFSSNLSRIKYFPKVGLIAVKAKVNNNKIKKINFFGDFIGKRDVSDLNKLLTNQQYNEKDIRELVSDKILKEIFGNNFVIDDFIVFLFGNKS